jgi:hypothetical protein
MCSTAFNFWQKKGAEGGLRVSIAFRSCLFRTSTRSILSTAARAFPILGLGVCQSWPRAIAARRSGSSLTRPSVHSVFVERRNISVFSLAAPDPTSVPAGRTSRRCQRNKGEIARNNGSAS